MSLLKVEEAMNRRYLVYEKKEEEESYEMRMIKENQIEGLLDVSMREMNGKANLYYDITGCISLAEKYKTEEITFEDCKKVLKSMQKCFQALDEYLLQEAHVSLEVENMYFDYAGESVLFVFLPKPQISIKDSLQKFAEFLLEKVDHTDEYAVQIAYRFYKDAKTGQFSIDNIMQAMNEAEGKKLRIKVEEDIKKISVVEKQELVVMGDYREKEENRIFQYNPRSVSEKAKEEEKDRKKHAGKELIQTCKWNILLATFALITLAVYVVSGFGEMVKKGLLLLFVLLVSFNLYQLSKQKKQKNVCEEQTIDVVPFPKKELPIYEDTLEEEDLFFDPKQAVL